MSHEEVRPTAIMGAFALGMCAGAMIAPGMASRSSGEPSTVVGPPVAASVTGAYAAEVLRVIDGDTFEARVHVWPGLAVTTKVRLRAIDAPEMNGRCTEERSKADAARAALNAILAEPDLIVLRVGLDKYGGRVLADVATLHTSDVAKALLAQGMARAYSGGRRESWCGS
jgi:endonuclease YncB( thermonuclease family)